MTVVANPQHPHPAPHLADEAALVDRAVALAGELLDQSLADTTPAERRRLQRLGALLDDPAGRALIQHMTDDVLRIAQPRRAARRFRDVVAITGIPRSLGRIDRTLLRVGAKVSPLAPRIVMPLAAKRIQAETAGIVLAAEDPSFADHVRKRTAEGLRMNVNVLGEAILSDAEADRRLDAVCQRLSRPDVDYVSVKISALCANLDAYAFEHSVDRIAERLRTLYRTAQARPTTTGGGAVGFVNLDMEEYRDLHLTVAAFTRVLDEPEFAQLDAGIVLQAYLPDSHDVMQHLGTWATARRAAHGGNDAAGGRIKVRIVKGANLAMEAVEASLHGWVQAPYATKADVDASYKRLLESALNPAWADAVRIGVASHNLFDVAWALVLRDEMHAAERMEIEMLEGMAPAQARAVARRTGTLLMYAPVVRHDELDASISYLSRRLDENTAPENFLRALFTIRTGTPTFEREADRFRAAVAHRHDVTTQPLRRLFVEDHRTGTFVNEPDSDLTDAATRRHAADALATHTPTAVPRIDTVNGIDAVVATAVNAATGWSARSFAERREVLLAVADVMATDRFATIARMAAEAGKTVAEADPEISEGIDFARYYATVGAARLEQAVAAGHQVTARGVVVVAAPWTFPYAIPAGGVFAALMAGNTVILKPAPETVQTAWLLAEQCWRAGVPRDVLQFVACPDTEVGRRLITHPDVDTVVLTGAYDTAQLFLGWKPSLRLLAETSGKNAVVVTAAADVDAAIRDVVRSAFGHAGQKCSAASLCIVEAAVYDDPSFLRRLAETVRSVRVGEGADPATMTGPLIAPPQGNLLRALTTLEAGEQWLVEPRQLDEAGRLWSPGVRTGVQPGSWFHLTECFGPVLGVMRATDLDDAIALQNATPYGLTGGLQSLDPAEIDHWLDRVEVGNAYVNRHITGAIVQRQPFGGWKRSSIGGAPKAGGPGYVAAFAHIDRAAATADTAAANASFTDAWRNEFAIELDRSGIAAERNGLRSRPLPHVVVRADAAAAASGARSVAEQAAAITTTTTTWSIADTETEAALIEQLRQLRPAKLRALCPISDDLRAACHALDVTVDESPVTTFGPIELPRWLREQSISETRHRYGRLLDAQ